MNAPAQNELIELLPGIAKEAIEQYFGKSAAEFRDEWAEFQKKLDREEKAQKIEMADRAENGMDRKYFEDCLRYVSRDPAKHIGLQAGRAIRAIIGAKMFGTTAEDFALGELESPWLADKLREARENYRKRALATTTVSAGGAIVPTEYVAELIELLRAESVLSQAGVRSLPMPSGSLQIPRQSGAATASYVGEASNATASDQSLEIVQMVGRKLAALTAVSNDLIRQSSPAADQFVTEDLVQVMSLRKDLAGIRGDGASNTPRGIRYWAASGNVTSASISSLATLHSTLTGMVGDVMNANVKFRKPFWLMHSRTLMGIVGQTDTTGQPSMYQLSGLLAGLNLGAMGAKAMLLGFPVFVSNQIPTNLGGGSDESELYFVESAECVFGEVYDLEVTVHENAAYHDGSSIQSGVNRDETVIRAISKHDFLLRHSQGASVRTAVTLGS